MRRMEPTDKKKSGNDDYIQFRGYGKSFVLCTEELIC